MTTKANTFFKSKANFDKTIYFGIGGGDGWGMREELKHYVAVVKENTPINLKWKHEEVGDENHDTSRLLLNYYGLKFVFSDLKASEAIRNNYTDSAFLKGEELLKIKYGEKARRPVGNYVDIALKLLSDKNNFGAINVFKRAVETYPKYIGLMTNLAKLYKKTNQVKEAIQVYKMAIQLSKKLKLGQEEGFRKEINTLEKK